MDVYKAKIQSDGSLDKLKLRIVVIVDLNNKTLVGDNWSPIYYIRTLKCFLAGAVKHKKILHQLDFIGAFLQATLRIGSLSSWTVDMKTISIILKLFWKILEISEVYVWND